MPPSVPSGGLNLFVKERRLPHVAKKNQQRQVYCTDIANKAGTSRLCLFIADRLPSFYRDPSKLLAALSSDYFISAVRDTLARLPDAASFEASHFGEVCSAVFAEDVLGLKRLYSKLSLLTSENANAFKMDLLLVDPNSDPLDFVFGEVKSSLKTDADGLPANHDKGIFADLFRSFNEYLDADIEFDLAAARDRIEGFSEPLKGRVKKALEPYAVRTQRFAGFVVIDATTQSAEETEVLATRKNAKDFEVDVLRLRPLPEVVRRSYGHLKEILDKCSP